MSPGREITAFALVLGTLVAGFLSEALFTGKVLSPADVLFVSASFRPHEGPDYEPANRLLTDPVLQFQPWLEFNRSMIRRGRLPLWNDLAGCGTPHLANGQCAVFDPVHLIAYCGTLPAAIAWMAALRLWVAGLGMFVLARSWGLGGWGRWFSGLTFPFCGFLVVWLLYPVTAVAVWMPWLVWASDRVLERPGPRPLGVLALVVGCVFLGGHVQTSAHVLLSSGAYIAWRCFQRRPIALAPLARWSLGVGLGLSIAAVAIVPLWVYLGKSPVWADRELERPSPWRLTSPRLLDTVCTAVPYAFGSQRRGHPNLARAVGVHNLNESAGGFAGLATLIWLAPVAWSARREQTRVPFLVTLTAFGFFGAFEFAPVVNLLRAIPVLNVTDHRRLVVWVAFGLVLLGGIGLDHLSRPWFSTKCRWWVGAAFVLCLAALASGHAGPWLRDRAQAHYAQAAGLTDGADHAVYQRRADRQVGQALHHVPRQLAFTAGEFAGLAALAALAGRGIVPWSAARAVLISLTLAELFGFGRGLNPAINSAEDRVEPAVIAELKRDPGPSGRVIGLGEELPPNVAMRYGLGDARNYDSVELSRNVDWLETLYKPDSHARSSRRTITWAGVVRARERLREASVAAVVSATPPPEGLALRAERVGSVWLSRLAARPVVTTADESRPTSATADNGLIDILLNSVDNKFLVIRQTFDPGWRAAVDGQHAEVTPYLGTFISVRVGAGARRVTLTYDPPEVRAACAVSLVATAVTVFALTGFRPIRSTRFPRQGLGPSRAVGIESGCDLHRKTGRLITEGSDADGPLHV